MEVRQINQATSISLDFVRGIAAQLVLIGHLWSFLELNVSIFPIPLVQNFGVLVFFIMSGFLITQVTLIKGYDYGFKNFFIDRFSRIFYTFIPALIFVLMVDFIGKQFYEYPLSYKFSVKSFFGNLFMLQAYPFFNYLGIESFGTARPFWTVAVEWWTYIFFGVIFFYNSIRNKFSKYTLILFSGILIIYYFAMRGSGLSFYWFLGLILSLLYNSNIKFKIDKRYFIPILLLIAIALIIRTYFSPNMYDMGIAIAFATILFLFFDPPKNIIRILNLNLVNKTSRTLANFSYSLYLIHYSLIVWLLEIFDFKKDLFSFAIIFCICNFMSYVFYLLFEKNNFKLRKYLKLKFSK